MSQSRDSTFSHIHMHAAHHADLLEDFTRIKLPAEEINVAPQHQPLNPDEEEDIVPDQHAAFGIQRAQQKTREPAWKDHSLHTLLSDAPPKQVGQASGGATVGTRALR